MQECLKILEKSRGKSAGIFVDEANLFYIQRKIGWKIDWAKVKEFLSRYLEFNLYHYYLGMPAKGEGLIENERIKKELEKNGKGFIAMCFEERVAWEIRRIYHIFFEEIKEFIEKK